MHTGWIGNQKVIDVSIEQIMERELQPKTISAIFISLKNRTQIFQFQRDVLNYKKEAISSVMPGVTLSRLWMLTGNVDKAFKFITFLIIIIALLGMIAMTIAGLNSRRREMAILRSVGASPNNIVSLLLLESIIISLISCIAPAIAMGNRVTAISPFIGSLTATDFYQVLETSDIPSGVINILTGNQLDLAPCAFYVFCSFKLNRFCYLFFRKRPNCVHIHMTGCVWC